MFASDGARKLFAVQRLNLESYQTFLGDAQNDQPRIVGMVTRTSTPSIFDFFHWIGNDSGLFKSTSKS